VEGGIIYSKKQQLMRTRAVERFKFDLPIRIVLIYMSFIDPIHGRIRIPMWLNRILNHPLVRRTMFIRQLGLKAYIDFPGAIHTRFSHLIGTMYLAEKLCNVLINKLSKKEEGQEAKEVLQERKTDIVIAGFLHDIGHGPFSHAIDYALKRILNQSHEELSSKLILEKFKELEPHADLGKVARIINGKYEYPFITKIINGPIDVDRLDFLVRDSYHVGLKYYFDIEHFIHKYTVIGLESQEELKRLTLGLEYTKDDKTAVTTAEIFFVIWRGMYDLVYYKDRSRIAEKMLEYAVLNKAQKDPGFKDIFEDIDKFSNLYDESLLSRLEKGNDFSSVIASRIKMGKLYEMVSKANIFNFAKNIECVNQLKGDPDDFSYKLTEKVCRELAYEFEADVPPIICDVVPSKILKEEISLSMVNEETGAPLDLREVSDLLSGLQSRFELRIYVDKERIKEGDRHDNFKKIKKTAQEIIENWQ